MSQQENPVMQDPTAELEQYFVAEYLRGKGLDLQTVRALSQDEFKRVMTEASTYASLKLTEVEDKAQFLRKIRSA
jgi:hypothetical protein